jgi:hypothetical protein
MALLPTTVSAAESAPTLKPLTCPITTTTGLPADLATPMAVWAVQ